MTIEHFNELVIYFYCINPTFKVMPYSSFGCLLPNIKID